MLGDNQKLNIGFVGERIAHIKEDIQEFLDEKKKLEEEFLKIQERVGFLTKQNKLHKKVDKYEVEYLREKLLKTTQEMQFVEDKLREYFNEKNGGDKNKDNVGE
jgi:predicted transcriptional regulator